MLKFDLRTILLMASIMPGLMALVIFSIGRTFPKHIRGVAQWGQGSLSFSAAALLLSLRGAIPDWLSVVVGNMCMVGGVGLWLIGSQRYLGRRPFAPLILAAVLTDAGCLSWMTWVHLNAYGRSMCTNLILAGLFGRLAYELLRFGKKDSGAIIVGCMFALETIITAMRITTALERGSAREGLYAHDWEQVVYLCSGAFVSLAITVGFLLTAMNKLRGHLEHLSCIDPLTGLLNRRAFLDAFGDRQKAFSRKGSCLALLLIDLDHFKFINDTYGHAVGDDILIDFAEQIAPALPVGAHFARWGGEEFAVLLPCKNIEESHRLASHLLACKGTMTDSPLPQYTFSIGVACIDGANATVDQLLKQADDALYRAKRNGRNRVEPTVDVMTSQLRLEPA